MRRSFLRPEAQAGNGKEDRQTHRRPLEGLEEKLTGMQEKGQIFGVQMGT